MEHGQAVLTKRICPGTFHFLMPSALVGVLATREAHEETIPFSDHVIPEALLVAFTKRTLRGEEKA